MLPVCGWGPKDMAPLAAHLFDASSNPKAEGLPPIQEISLAGAKLRLLFGKASPTDVHRSLVERLVREQQEAGPYRIMFQAVKRVTLDDTSIALEFLPPREPEMIEVSRGHRCACNLYPSGMVGEAA